VWEIRAALNVVVGNEAEDAALRIYGGFVVERAVFEMEGETRRYAIAAHDLNKVASSKNLALLGGQRQEAVQCPLEVMNPNWLCGDQERNSTNQRGNVSPASNR
jgi:hypothetical protein